MKTLLAIDSSARVNRSITRALTSRFASHWSRLPDSRTVRRDLAASPPPGIDEAWIAAAFGKPEKSAILAQSDLLIDEILEADVIVAGVPMYNFAAPASFKAYIDQIVRIQRTFSFDSSSSEPYRPMLSAKPFFIITSAGEGDIHPGGPLAHLNFLEPHLEATFGFIGLTNIEFIRVGYDEYKDDRWKYSVASAEHAVDQAAARLSASFEKSAAA